MVDVGDIFKKLTSGTHLRNKLDFLNNSRSGDLLSRHQADDAKDELDFFGKKDSNAKDQKIIKDKSDPRKGNKRKILNDQDIFEIEENENSSKPKKKKKSLLVSAEKSENLRQEKVNRSRNELGISVRGADIPDPFVSFNDLKQRFKCPSYILDNLASSGYDKPTPVQMQAVPLMLNRREILVCAPTGSGKTLAFILPILQCLQKPKRDGFRAVVISPTRELANQIYREFNRLSSGKGFRIHLLTKSKAASGNFTKKADARYDVLITTPNRLVYLLSKDPPQITLDKVEWLVLDEGDKLFEEGATSFREQIATIFQACNNPTIRRALFSATLANDVEQWCSLHLDNFVRVLIGVKNAATETVKQELKFVGQESGKLLAMREILRLGFSPPILVFVQSKERAKELFNELIYDGINVDVIHADRTQAQRDNIVKSFRTGKVWVLIATELMGRGIDFKGVNLVINYDFPTSAVSYIHRIGRTGRAGRPGTAITFFTEEDVVNLRSIANVMVASGCEIPSWISDLKNPTRKTKRKLQNAPVERESIASLSRIKAKSSKSMPANKNQDKPKKNPASNVKTIDSNLKKKKKKKKGKKILTEGDNVDKS